MSDFSTTPGYTGVVARSTAGHPSSPTWSEIDKARDISENAIDWTAIESGGRDSDFMQYIRGRGDGTVKLHWEAFNDAAFAAADSNDQLLFLAILSGPIATVGTRGWKGYFIVTNKSEPYTMDGGKFTDFTLKPAATATPSTAKVEITE
jgi:hypothetical protein